ncbi:MAG TPA: hypothetical protein HPP76_05670 [Desulfuromonadales bacterium]|nr:hypothetical protein [Desulfuromonadales bacterium]
MKRVIPITALMAMAASLAYGADTAWYTGDERCQPPKDDGTYSAPYNAQEYSREYPTFSDADKQGWSCSYQRENGTIVQFGDSRSPQQQWLSLWGGNDSN